MTQAFPTRMRGVVSSQGLMIAVQKGKQGGWGVGGTGRVTVSVVMNIKTLIFTSCLQQTLLMRYSVAHFAYFLTFLPIYYTYFADQTQRRNVHNLTSNICGLV